MPQEFDVIVLGGGAAGLMCAMEAGKRGRRVAVLELADRIGKKILISGGGRCNFTNLHCSPENFLSANSHFCKSALARYIPADFIALVKRRRIPYHEKTLGQLFCDRSAHDILNMLEEECRDAGVRIYTGTRVQEVLHISHYWKKAEPCTIDLAPDKDLTVPLRQPKARRDLPSAKAAFHAALPLRVAERWLDLNPPQGWSNHALEELERHAHHWQIIPEGTEGYDKAEVTAGGVDTNELSAKTMESRKVPGLYFIGEVVDVTGHLGGFNFQWAWASGFCAGQAV